MQINELPALAEDYAVYRDLRAGVGSGGILQVEGLPPILKAFFLARLQPDLGRPLAIVSYNAEQAASLYADLLRFGVSKDEIVLLPSTTDTLIFTEGAPDLGLLGRRTAALQRVARAEPKILVGSIGAFLQLTVPRDRLVARFLDLAKGAACAPEELERTLISYGYERVESVEQHGQWTRRGGIVDVFAADWDQPCRIDFFGDEIETLRPFDIETQRSSGAFDRLILRPCREAPYESDSVKRAVGELKEILPGRMAVLRNENLEERGVEHAERLEERIAGDIAQLASHSYFDMTEYYLPFLFPDAVPAFELLAADTVLVLDEPAQAEARWQQTQEEAADIAAARAARGEWLKPDLAHGSSFSELGRAAHGYPTILFSLLSREVESLRPNRHFATQAGAMETFAGRLPAFLEAIDSWLGARFRCVIVSEQADRVRNMLAENKLPTSPSERLEPGGESGLYVLSGSFSSGFKLPEAGLVLATDTDIFGHKAHHKPQRRAFKEGLKITSYLELREGDYVVHINHGIGHYAGITRLKGADGAERDYLLLEYADNDKVYVPIDQVDRVQKYIGPADTPPVVTRLHSGEWSRATRRAKKQVREMAADLIKLYATRKASVRPALLPDTPWQIEMEEAFPYDETPDQLAAIEDVKNDLEQEQPMDRLICGDVGYGKTEVAIRAAFKVVNSGRQVAVLCPTTILAQQHLSTFRDRLAGYPVRVEMVSRFVARAEANQIAKDLADGAVDIVIGTHKLLGRDIQFSKLGLLIVDEEQRFGVAHKERIKQMKKSVDVLTMTATPIPRTLHMSLSGIRDMSLIDDPPEGRLPIKTYVREYDDELVREVILREIDRQGQVFFVHNRVESISHVAERIRRLVPGARLEYAHGQMNEHDLEDAMVRFANGDYDVLVCTTIVESGLDIPRVNSIIVNDADKLGLAQLYQLRGRIGRSNRQGYAYLLYRRDKALSENAEKRLSALREFSDLGSGYKVALRDLEIRGAGNLLGAEQSGTVATVGFDLYTQLLSHAINELKGEDLETEWELPNVALPLDALLPARYIPSEAERILLYKKLTAVRKRQDVDRIQEELEDRYGDPPRPVWNVLAILRLRLRCQEVGIGSIVAEKRRVAIRFSGTHLTQESLRKLSRAQMQHQFLPDVVFLATPDTPARMLQVVEEMVETLAGVLPPVLEVPKTVKKRDPLAALWGEPDGDDEDDLPKPKKVKKAPPAENGTPAAGSAQARNLVTNQVSARRRGTIRGD